MELLNQIAAYRPCCEQEETDRRLILQYAEIFDDLFTRQNEMAHFTASAWIVTPDRSHALMAYHNLYDSWAWLGGHADGEQDLLSVALREAREESGSGDPAGHAACQAREIRFRAPASQSDLPSGGGRARRAPLQAGREQQRALVPAGRGMRGGLGAADARDLSEADGQAENVLNMQAASVSEDTEAVFFDLNGNGVFTPKEPVCLRTQSRARPGGGSGACRSAV